MCGILGIIANHDVAQEIYDGLIVLQHRGQDSAGIVTYDGRFNLKKGNGMVRDVFRTKNMLRLKGSMGIGHVRYPTAGSHEAAEAQPFYVNSPFGLTLIHNGNLTNAEQLKKDVIRHNIRYLNTTSDSEVLLNVVADELLRLHKLQLKPSDIFRAMGGVFKRLKGSYSCLMMIAGYGMVAFRDPHGIRPLIFGERKNSGMMKEYIIASESVPLAALGFDIVSDVQPGEVVFIDMKRRVFRQHVAQTSWSPCIFELVYLARPDSVIDKISVYKSRLRMGHALARQIQRVVNAHKLDIDVVMPIPDSARSAALAVAEVLGLRYREGLVKNRYIGRTFIMPDQAVRKKSIKYKLMPIELELRKKNILLVDDSIVRGNTSKKIIQMVREAGAKKVYFASACPPLRYPCAYGVDLPTKREFIANQLSIPQIAKEIGADGVFYLELKDLIMSAHEGNKKITHFCVACMDGKYPTKEVNRSLLAHMDAARKAANLDRSEDADSSQDEQLSLL